jgi:hypothetical protein
MEGVNIKLSGDLCGEGSMLLFDVETGFVTNFA